ncbi:uncharacterized protein LOC120542657 [Polypterus senegalus]|uniref:uncharacterized protein LOC120542657 n=1 Tax=Polypterus senegalus TaxID=55291 RepID=UPI0019623A56|nr:uncharacterized protein LOC120542657 [Polypterus senegalus]
MTMGPSNLALYTLMVLAFSSGLVLCSGSNNSVPLQYTCSLLNTANVSVICESYNSTEQNITANPCDNNILDYICPIPNNLNASIFAALINCLVNDSVNYTNEELQALFQTNQGILDAALLLNLTTPMIPSQGHMAPQTDILNTIFEIKISNFSSSSLSNVSFISQLFSQELKPFLPFASPDFFACLSTVNFTCNSYQEIIKDFSAAIPNLANVSTIFIPQFMSTHLTSGSFCIDSTSNRDWLLKNFGSFITQFPYSSLTAHNSNFLGINALDLLNINQIADVVFDPKVGALNNSAVMNQIFNRVQNTSNSTDSLNTFMQNFALRLSMNNITTVNDTNVGQVILNRTLQISLPILQNNNVSNTTPLGIALMILPPSIIANNLAAIPQSISCSNFQMIIQALGNSAGSLSPVQSQAVAQFGVNFLTAKGQADPTQLPCSTNQNAQNYLQNNFNTFSSLLNFNQFFSFVQVQTLTANSGILSPTNLATLIGNAGVINNSTLFATVLNHVDVGSFIEDLNALPAMANLSSSTKATILNAIWPFVVNSNTVEFDQWIGPRLQPYLAYLTPSLLNATLTGNCSQFQTIIRSVHSELNDSQMSRFYTTIKGALASGTTPRCYNSSNPALSSTAWLANYLGPFIAFTSQTDLQSFAPNAQLQLFSQDPTVLNFFNTSAGDLPDGLLTFYTSLLFSNSSFTLSQVPGRLLCYVPSSQFNTLGQSEALRYAQQLNLACGMALPSISASLAQNIQNVTSDAIAILGSQCSGLSQSQLQSLTPDAAVQALSTLSQVSNWNQGQANQLISTLIKGNFQVDNATNLLSLGSLVQGLPSSAVKKISPDVAVNAGKNPTFVANMLAAPSSVQIIFISQIINANTSNILQNVPDSMSNLIPMTMLTFSKNSFDTAQVDNINKKNWSPDQAAMFFTNLISSYTNYSSLSANVLQGFSSTTIQGTTANQVVEIVKACKQKNAVLKEDQLMSMVYYVNIAGSIQNFTSFPPNMLLYYKYTDVQNNCVAYFQQLGNADFAIISPSLTIASTLLTQALACLNITGNNISSANLNILNNMVCLLSGPYIQNSDTSITEKLKLCSTLTADQVTSLENILLNGSTQYGNPSTWTLTTLQNLEQLPLFLTNRFWSQFTKSDIVTFLGTFLPQLKSNKVSNSLIVGLFQNIFSTSPRARRGAGCTVGNITLSIINSASFPASYDSTQFSYCLDPQTVQNNLAALASAVLVPSYQLIVYNSLKQAYPSGIPESQLQLLRSIARQAPVTDINTWNITSQDTLTALLNPADGAWNASQSGAIIARYLSVSNNALDSTAINAIGGNNLCSATATQLAAISSTEMQKVSPPLDVSSCPIAQKQALYTVCKQGFSNATSGQQQYYTLIKSYLGGAPLNDILQLANNNVSMSIPVFSSLDPAVLQQLNASVVKSLLGSNLGGLATFQNTTAIQNWIQSRTQAELASLGIGLTGGSTGSTASPSSSTSKGCQGTKEDKLLLLVTLLFTALIAIQQRFI